MDPRTTPSFDASPSRVAVGTVASLRCSPVTWDCMTRSEPARSTSDSRPEREGREAWRGGGEGVLERGKTEVWVSG